MGDSSETPPNYEKGVEAQVSNDNGRQRRFKIIRNIILTIICCVAFGFLFYFMVTVGIPYLAEKLIEAIFKLFEDSPEEKKYNQEMLEKGCEKKCMGSGLGIFSCFSFRYEWACESCPDCGRYPDVACIENKWC